MNDIPADSLPLTTTIDEFSTPDITDNGFSEVVTTVISDADNLRFATTTTTISDSELIQQIAVNTKQSADCLTTVVAFLSIFLFYLLGKWLYNIFKSFF